MTRRARDILLDILRDEGITHIFGNPGSTEMPLMDALVDAPDIRYVLGLQEATAVGMADGWALATGRTGFVNLHAMGGLGNAMGVLVASKASETPLVVTAGQQDTRHLMTEPWLSGDLVAPCCAGDQMGEGVAPRARMSVRRCAAPSASRARRRAARCSCRCRWTCSTRRSNDPTPPASAPPRLGPSPDAARLAEKLAGLDPDRVVVLLGDDLPAAASAGLVAFAESGGFPVWGAQLTSRTAFPSAPSLLGGRDEAGFRLDARAPAVGASDRAGRRPRLRRLPLSRGRAGARRRRRSCMSRTTPRRSDASTRPTWRSSATSARTLATVAERLAELRR